MKKSRFTDSQIMAVLKRAESGEAVPELCREIGVSTATFYKWRAKFGGMDVSIDLPPLLCAISYLRERLRVEGNRDVAGIHSGCGTPSWSGA